MDFGAVSRNSVSVMPTSLTMLRPVFNAYRSSSRDLEGYYAARIAARVRKTSTKNDLFREKMNVKCCKVWYFFKCPMKFLNKSLIKFLENCLAKKKNNFWRSAEWEEPERRRDRRAGAP